MILDEILENIIKYKENVAYTVDDNKYTYQELYKYVCNIYHHLLIENPNRKPVVVYGSKEIFMKATFLACSFAGMSYVPIDSSMSNNRVDSIIEQLEAELIVGDFKSDKVKNISKNEIEEIMNAENCKTVQQIYLKPQDIVYIIFTSGSTGTPKGVKVTYRNLNSCVEWLKNIMKPENEVVLNQASFSFDLSVADFYLSLINGSEHFILEKQIQTNFRELFEKLKTSNASIAVMTPSFADLLLLDKSFNEKLMPKLKKILFCGEKLLSSTVEKIYSRFKDVTVINSYGPTECTFAVTSIEIERNLKEENISIGIPKKDVEIFIVNEKLEEMEDETDGEILIVGESVADGYVSGSGEAFIIYNGKKGYLTGDLGYKRDGKLYYKCRKDKQIKYKGYRIELNDIETNLYKLNNFEKVVVIPKLSKENKVIKILAFVQLKKNVVKTESEIKKELLNIIPEYMCPNIKIIKQFPLNKNGKCDEKKLLEEYSNGR